MDAVLLNMLGSIEVGSPISCVHLSRPDREKVQLAAKA